MNYHDWSDPMNSIFATIHGRAVDPITNEELDVYKYKIVNNKGMSIEVSEYGATLLSAVIRDIDAKDAELDEEDFVDVVLGLPDLEDYVKSECYFGATIGRVSNRLPNARINIPHPGNTEGYYKIEANDRETHHFNGGTLGFHKMIWKFHAYNTMGITLCHVSPDHWLGYPGEVTAYARFTLTTDNMLNIEYTATSTQLTYLNMSSHLYFNLAGHGSGTRNFGKHMCVIRSEFSIEKDSRGVCTGNLVAIEGTPSNLLVYGLDMSQHLRAVDNFGFDIDYVIAREHRRLMVEAGYAQCRETSLGLEVLTNQMGAVLYTGSRLPRKGLLSKGIKGKDNANYYKNQSFCLMPQKVPDVFNFQNNYHHYQLKPKHKEVYHHDTLYRFSFDTDARQRLRVGVPKILRKGRSGRKYYEPVWDTHSLFTRNKQLFFQRP